MDQSIEPPPLQPIVEFSRRHEIGELALGQIAPFSVLTEQIANRDVGAAGVIEGGHDIRPDKAGAAGHQQHSVPCLDPAAPALPHSAATSNVRCYGLRKAAMCPTGGFTARRGAATDLHARTLDD